MTAPASMPEWSSPQPYSRPQSEIFTYEKVLVVLDGSRQITKYALEWALSNVLVRPGESITVLALHATGSHGKSYTHTSQFVIKTAKFELQELGTPSVATLRGFFCILLFVGTSLGQMQIP